MQFEKEYMELMWRPCMEFTYTTTRQGWSGSFGLFNIVEHYHYFRLPFLASLDDDWTKALPETAAAFDRIESDKRFDPSSDVFAAEVENFSDEPSQAQFRAELDADADAARSDGGGGGAGGGGGSGGGTPAPKTGAEHAAQYRLLMEEGIGKHRQHFEKLHAHLTSPMGVVLHLFCRGYSGSAARAIFGAISQHFPDLLDPKFEYVPPHQPPHRCAARDKAMMDIDKTEAAARELLGYVKLWSLLEPSVQHDFVTLTQNQALERDSDKLVDSFAHGDDTACEEVFDHLSGSMGPCATSDVRVELNFSEKKQVRTRVGG